MSIVPVPTTEHIWFGTRAVKFEGGGSTGPQLEVLDSSSDFATRALVAGGVADYTGSEWQQMLAFSGTTAELATLGINLANGVDTALSGSVDTTGDLRVGMGVEAHNIADVGGGGRVMDTSGTLDGDDDPIAISGFGKANSARLSGATTDSTETGNRAIFSNEIGFGFINGSGVDSGGSSNATRLNDGDAINVEIKQGRELSQASFTVKVLGSGSTSVVIDSDGRTIRDTNEASQGGFVQDASAGELNLGMLAHGTKVTINYVNETIWFNGAVMFSGDTSGFFTAFESGGSKNLTLGSVVGNNTGWSADDLVLSTDAPNASPIALGYTGGTGSEDSPILGDVNASDPNGDTLAYAVAMGDGPANGSVVVNAVDGTFTYTPGLNFNGADSFTVTITDGHGGSTTQLVNIAVAAVNDAPTAAGYTGGAGNEDTAILGDVNATDVDGDALAYTVGMGDGPAHGGVVVNAADGTFNYTPSLNFNGADSFTVTISDGNGGTATQLVSITLAAVNDAPTAAGYTGGAGNEDTAILGDVNATDVDGDMLAYTVGMGDGPANGGVVVNAADGTFTYTPSLNFNGADSFTVTISDGNGGSTTQLVGITVNAVNDAASFGGTALGSVAEDGTLAAGGTLTVSDVDTGEASFASTGTLAATYGNFAFTLGSGAWTYTLRNADANVQALITGQTVQDTLLVSSADGSSTTITVNIAGANEPVLSASLPSATTGIADPTDTLGGGATGTVVFSPPGGGSANLVTGTTGANLISAANNNDTVYGYAGADTINGDNGNDALFGQADDDVINGNDGSDTLFGGSGADSLSGGSGGDLLVGGYGPDTLNGGADADTFRFVDAKDTNDILTGYVQAADIIDFAALSAGTLGFNATASKGFAAANSVSWFIQGGNTIIIAELDGNVATAELMLTIQGQTLTMAAANFIL